MSHYQPRMDDDACVQFLQWALPRLRMRWAGFRKVRRQVCKRLRGRIRQFGLADLSAYRDFLKHHSEEWQVLDGLCRITISRFYRDKGVFECLEREILPDLIRLTRTRQDSTLRVWSAGCGSGEEPYSLALLWSLRLHRLFPSVDIRILATDVDPRMIARAQRACYSAGSLQDLADEWRRIAFDQSEDRYCLRSAFQRDVTLLCHDVRNRAPHGPFHLILCRNLAFTYFEHELQLDVLHHLRAVLHRQGALVIGAHETLPLADGEFVEWSGKLGIYRKAPTATAP